MQRHVTFVEPQEKGTTQWRLHKEHTAPILSAKSHVTVPVMRRPHTRDNLSAGNPVKVPVMPRPPTRGQSSSGSRNSDDDDKSQQLQREATQLFERERSRLMEKPGATTAQRHSHDPAAWGEKGGGGGGGGAGGGAQHTQYIRRLADLRDELINQEETALARALDRLRLHSINNRDAARYRLKIKDPAGESPRVPGMQLMNGSSPFPRPMVTTVEKFRQMRPQRRPPVIFPLQGKQLIDSPPISNGNGSTTRSSSEEGGRVEDTVKANLQRLIQPTSSIPNIGRKALRQESLELKTQSLHNMRNRVFKANRPHMASPFMLGAQDEEGGMDSREDSEGELHLTPHAYKLGPMTDGDRLNMDKLNQYYYICCLPDTPVSREGERRSVALSTPRQGQPRKGLSRLGGPGRTRRTSSERSQVSRPFSERSSVGGLVVSSDTEVEAPSSSRHKASMDTMTGSERVTLLPVIHAESESPTHPPQPRHPREAFLTQADRRSPSTPDTLLSTERRRRHIVVDMPHIIFNAATPDISKEPATVPESFPLPDRPGALSKTLKQNEIRHRELQNLLEDVKELNKRTETLNTHAQNSERDAQAGVC